MAMKKNITITALLIFSYWNLSAQLAHYKGFNNLNYCSTKIQTILESHGNVKGKVKRIISREGYSIIELTYDRNSNLTHAKFQDPTIKQEVDYYFDEQGTLYMEKSPCLSYNGEDFILADSVSFHYRKFSKSADTSSFWGVAKKVGKKLVMASIDHIYPNKNFREITTFNCSQTSTFLLADTSILRKADNIEWGKKMIEEGELVDYQKVIWTYDEKNKPIKLEDLRISQGDLNAKSIVYDLKYENENRGTMVGGREPYYKFFINRFGEVTPIKSFEPISDEKFEYDKNGNWTTHTFKTMRRNKILEVNETRKIEYWEE